MSTKKKIIISVSIAVAVIVAVVCVILFAPLPMHIDWDSIYDIESNVQLLEAGADVLVAGNYVFHAADPHAAISTLKRL